MPRRELVDPAFDGHLERPFAEWSAEEKLAWLWETMRLLRLGEAQRARVRAAARDRTGGPR